MAFHTQLALSSSSPATVQAETPHQLRARGCLASVQACGCTGAHKHLEIGGGCPVLL